MKEPINKTWLGVAILDPVGGKSKSWSEDVFYKDCPKYKHIPEPCRCPEIRVEWEAWWNWRRMAGKGRNDST